jgi:succinate dehydrogenase / fumarate reductase cytochrome b subunit
MFERFLKTITSSIMKKQLMGITGLMLCGFLVTHLAGNFLIFVSPEAFNTYAYKLTSTPLIYVAEAILLAIFLTHIGLAMRLTIENKMARPIGYYMKQPTGRGSTFASSTMPITGIGIGVFVVLHIIHFKFGAYYDVTYGGVEMRDLYRLLIEEFQNKAFVFGYIVAMAFVGVHVSHGFWSSFQSIGFNHPKYNTLVRGLSTLYAIAVFGGFSALPIYCFLQGVK